MDEDFYYFGGPFEPRLPCLPARMKSVEVRTRLRVMIPWLGAACVGLSCGESDRQAEPGASQASQQSGLPADRDSAAAAKAAISLVTGVLDTANIRIIRYERTDSGYVFSMMRALPSGVGSGDGGWRVLVDSATMKARLLWPAP